ncbi:DUF4352 domain-containing protein [Clostridium sp. FAM 1755]|uniref:DUF4352 domain-containing protein n=1 Tax=Clostridium caseinilyticum TaxID=3350403 RepID=UPI0038F5EE86
MKKNFKLIIGGLIIFIAGYFIGDATAINRVNKNISQETNAKEEVKQEKKDEGNKTFKKLGEEGINNSFSYKVLEVKNNKQIKTGDLESEIHKTDKNYCTVKLQMTNKGNIPAQAGDKNLFTLVDTKSKQLYYPNSDITIELNSYNKNMLHQNVSFISDDLNPNVPTEVTIVFEIPTEVKDKNFSICIVDTETKKEKLYLDLFK